MITEKFVHIVSQDVPYPVENGSVVDLYNKLATLHNLGVKIFLHCFTKNNIEQPVLNKFCEAIHYYPLMESKNNFSFKLPFILKSKQCQQLIDTLNKDDYPVLLEGIECTYYLYTGSLKNRKIIVRLHKPEFEYYNHLAKHEKNWFKKIHFLHQSKLLKKYEKVIANRAIILAVSEPDVETYKAMFGAAKVDYMPVFTPFKLAVSKEGRGSYCLYHGNLSIYDNEQAVTWLLNNVFNNLKVPFVIAGKNPTKKLVDIAHKYPHTCIVENLSENEMQDLIAKAQINILPSFNKTGIKLKLLNAIFNGRHIIVNDACVHGTGLSAACHTAEDAKSVIQKINQLYHQYFTDDEIQLRQGLLNTKFNNTISIKKITDIFWAGETFLNLNAGVI
jgi:glycosyltransferase involved in cell wall biosynthesis